MPMKDKEYPQNKINESEPLIMNIDAQMLESFQKNKTIHDDVPAERFFKQIWDMWIQPEIIKRIKRDKLESYRIPPVMVVGFPSEKDKPPYVLLDKECNVKATVKVRSGIEIRKGEPIYDDDVLEFVKSDIPASIGPDDGYILLIGLKKEWIIRFDFRIGRNIIKNKHERLIEFLDSAEHALNQNNVLACTENLFATVELLVDLLLLLKSIQEIPPRNHGGKIKLLKKAIHEKQIYRGKFIQTCDKLSNNRTYARYYNATGSKMSIKEINTHLQVAKKRILSNKTNYRII